MTHTAKNWRSSTSITKKKVVEASNVSFVRDARVLLDNISFQLNQEEHTVILGKNGSGKSTLLNLLYGIEWPTFGDLFFQGQKYGQIPTREIQKKTGILQSAHQSTALQHSLTAADIVMTGIFGSIGYYDTPRTEDTDRVAGLLREHGLSHLHDRRYQTLSDGEKKKVLLLRAVIGNPALLILDEPCSSFDMAAREEFFTLLNACRENFSFSSLLITHRLDEIPEFYNSAILLKEGGVLAEGKISETLTSDLVTKTYGLPLEVIARNGRFHAVVI